MVYLRTVFALIACQEASLFGGHLVLVSIRFHLLQPARN
jgi:hypothetical protein